MTIDSEIRFSWILLGREPVDEQELLYVYAAKPDIGRLATGATDFYNMRSNSITYP